MLPGRMVTVALTTSISNASTPPTKIGLPSNNGFCVPGAPLVTDFH